MVITECVDATFEANQDRQLARRGAAEGGAVPPEPGYRSATDAYRSAGRRQVIAARSCTGGRIGTGACNHGQATPRLARVGEVSAPRWLDIELILAIHDMQIAAHGGAPGVRDRNLLESGLARPENAAAYGEPDTCSLAAAYAFGLARNRPFVDGNER